MWKAIEWAAKTIDFLAWSAAGVASIVMYIDGYTDKAIFFILVALFMGRGSFARYQATVIAAEVRAILDEHEPTIENVEIVER